ncbi:hypothetical protein JYP46_01485 [Nitratireductor aquimarinus]|uniref:hypothetical protein n=1 Tax=Alphaproteobacteria TaxID=28211 RepID=UPI0019D3AD56|nr:MULTISPECIES: hypothetical protein [Alphaproteobacteria]MBN7755483.1 hypothetical protein [Nitratireductor aquimarinus]MBY5998238.1 hypothetical protein [Tritonibacter mobilis]MBY6020266.1 hypothetical protein [Nitratireductor sp. DP7N14-4]
MTIEESANLVEAGSDELHPSDSIDNPENLDYWEPDEEANPEAEGDEGTDGDSEPDEADAPEEDGQESENPDDDEASEETEGEAEDTDQPEVDDDVTVTLQGGEQVPLKELKLGYMREKDYRHKTMDLGEQRRGLEELSARVTRSIDAIAEALGNQIPDMPDATLATTDPSRYVREKAMHESAMAQVTQLIEKANEAKDVASTLTQEQHQQALQAENAKLAEAFPQTATPEGRKKFFDSAASAAKELGYSDDDIMGVTDHRMFKLAYYARLGMEAEQAKTKATQKVAKAPKVAPTKRQAKSATQVKRNRDAMKRLSQTGSLHDAMRIDFD